MRKDVTRGRGGKGTAPGAVRGVRIGEVLVRARAALSELVVGAGMQVLAALLEQDREALCGPKHLQNPARDASRYGHDEGTLVMGGRKVHVRRPRVRGTDGEVQLPTWEQLSREDPLNDRAVEQMLVGVSTRDYAQSLEPLPPDVATSSVSRSSVSRRFVAQTSAQVDAFLSRPLSKLDVPVIMIDGTALGDHVLVVALGIDTRGKKHVLGVREGSTESHEVCLELLRSLIDRGLAERVRLFVLDGGKGLRKAVREAFGDSALIQRCQVHKLRNVVEHLPEGKRARVGAAMRQAWTAATEAEARRQLQALARELDTQHPGAAASLREGLDETLTIMSLGVNGALGKTLCSTNPIENLNGLLKRVVRNVKRWSGGQMVLRWATTGLMRAEKRFRRIRGHKQIDAFVAVLDSKAKARKAA
jgi:putative transposase